MGVGVIEKKLSKLIEARGIKRLGEFLELLYRSAEEYGFDNEGILRIAYEARDFKEWMIIKAKGKIDRINLYVRVILSKELDTNWQFAIVPRFRFLGDLTIICLIDTTELGDLVLITIYPR
ncbi:hypothetical protein NC651_008312 [Populus alba x Populus x berolinensis]|nr:hypothetical protein NC651_008312 [Populus alba x Populus x berolinensis]